MTENKNENKNTASGSTAKAKRDKFFGTIKKISKSGALLLIVALITTFAVGFASWLIVGNNVNGTEGSFVAYDVSEQSFLKLSTATDAINVEDFKLNKRGFLNDGTFDTSTTGTAGTFKISIKYVLDTATAYNYDYFTNVSSNKGSVIIIVVLTQTGGTDLCQFVTSSAECSFSANNDVNLGTKTTVINTDNNYLQSTTTLLNVPTTSNVTITVTYTLKNISTSDYENLYSNLSSVRFSSQIGLVKTTSGD